MTTITTTEGMALMRIRCIDQIGKTVNGFKILDFKRENRRSLYLTVCPYCKKEKWIRCDMINSIKSCGCYNEEHNYRKPVDIANKMFGLLKADYPTDLRDKYNGSVIWHCTCGCGGEKLVSVNDLQSGLVKSCGCMRKEISKSNGRIAGVNIRDNYCFRGTNVKNLTSKIAKNNTSGVKGVSWDKSRNKWIATIRFQGKNFHLGRYDKLIDAVKARRTAEENIFGNFLEWYNSMLKNTYDNVQSLVN